MQLCCPDKFVMVSPLPLLDIFLTSTTPDGVIIRLSRSKNSLVHFWISPRLLLLHTHLPRIPITWQPGRLVCLLHHLPWPFQRRMGCFTDQPHELSSLPNVFQKTQSNNFFIQDKLNNLRNTFTFISNFFVLGMGVIIFKLMSDRIWEYRIISYVVAATGLAASIFFITNVKEIPLSKACHEKAE